MQEKLFVLLGLFVAAGCMIFAWLGHLKFNFSFFQAFLFSWFVVVPEYLLNTYFTKMGKSANVFTPAEMSFISILSGIIFTYLITIYFFKKPVETKDLIGGFFIAVGAVFIFFKR